MELVDSLEAIVAILDQGYCNMTLSAACTMAYLPTRTMQKFPINSPKSRINDWVNSDNYETALIELSEEARNVEIVKCKVKNACGFFFSKEMAEAHFWSVHQGQTNSNMDQAKQPNNTVMKATSGVDHAERAEKEWSNTG